MSVYEAPLFEKVDHLRDRLSVHVCSLYRACDDEEELLLTATSGLNKASLGARLAFSEGLTGKVAREKAPVAVRDVRNHPEFFYVEGSDEEKYRSYLGIPLLHNGAIYGVLVVQTTEVKTFFHSDISQLYALGSEVLAWLRGAS